MASQKKQQAEEGISPAPSDVAPNPEARSESTIRFPESVHRVPIASLAPYPKNARVHSPEQVAKIARSLSEFGWTVPVLIDSHRNVIAGHGRILAARELGLREVPVIELAALTAEQVRAYRIADNALALDAGWDEDLLAEELKSLKDLDFDISLLGFDENELLGLLDEPEAIEVPSPEPPETPAARLGDLWILGDHRLLVGDSAKPEDVDRLLGGAPIHMVNTDPPYNVKVEPRSNNAIAAGLSSFSGAKHHQSLDVARHPGKSKATGRMRPKDRPLLNDYVTDEAFDALLLAWFGSISRALLPGRTAYIWGGYANCGNYPPVLKAVGLYFSQTLIWVKEHPVLTRKDFMGNHEWCFYSWKEGAAHQFFGPANVPDVWSVKKVNPQSMVHLTEKPVELAARAIRYSSRPGENVLDLFGGSGSTLIAAEQTGRHAFLSELDESYAEVIITRWQEATGRKAVLDGDGRTFDEIRAARVPDAAPTA